MNDFLKSRLDRVIRRLQWLRLARRLTICWTFAALAALALIGLQQSTGWSSPFEFPLIAAIASSISLVLFVRGQEQKPSYQAIARKIEDAYPELRGLLLTAVQQLDAGDKPQTFLQYRVVQQAVEHCQQTQSWRRAIPRRHVRWATAAQFAALALFAMALWEGGVRAVKPHAGHAAFFAAHGITVTPGDTALERGESLFVLARFGGTLPPGVDLVINDAASPARKIPLVKSLADPMFGGSVPEVAGDFTYHLDYGGEHTREYTVKVYEHPRLVRSDVDLKFPGYTQLAPKRIEDTRRVSAVEGSQLGLTLQLNKPVASAKLIARNKEKTEIPLTVVADKATASVSVMLGEGAGPSGLPTATNPNGGPSGPALPSIPASQTYELKLVDAEGRANKVTTAFVIDVQPNRRPELKLVSPRGDVRPSALEEISFEGTVWDDFGSPAYGLAYSVAGQETKFLELGHDAPAKEKKTFSQLVHLEDLGVKPDDLVSWYLWADDLGPDGKVRRTSTDMYFAEIRPFEEIFRESQGMQSQQDQQQQQRDPGDHIRQLANLEKQIINATWKLQRDSASATYAEDTKVVHDSQQQALQQATEAVETNPRRQGLLSAATKQMEEASKQLAAAAKSPKALDDALKAEQAAFQSLLKLQARETNVARQRGQGGQNSDQAGNQRQLDELDLTQSENRYETQRQARAPQSPQRQEQNQILNRLQELARRQQDVNDRLKELQTALQAARTEQEKEDVRRQLKRLQEEQQQMLSDLDETRQRMDRPQNQSAMQPQRDQLDQTRDDLQRASDAAAQGSVSQALAAGTRAQRQLQQMRDELRKQNSSEFADELREMRAEARDLAQQQADTAKKIAGLENPQRRTLSDTPDKQQALDQLAQEQKRMNDLVQRATQVSEQAETSEPLLSRQLYDSVRKVAQDDVKTVKDFRRDLNEQGMLTTGLNERLQHTADGESGAKALELTTEMLREGYLPQASQAAQRASEGITELKRGVERAAESVLGDDAEALKLAQSELDTVTQQLERELAQAGAQPDPQRGAGGSPSESPAQKTAAAGQSQNNRAPGQPGETPQPSPDSLAAAGGGRPGENQPPANAQDANQRQRDQRQSPAGATQPETLARDENRNGGQPGDQPQDNQPGNQAQPNGGQRANQPGNQRGNQVSANQPQRGGGQQNGGRQNAGGQNGGQRNGGLENGDPRGDEPRGPVSLDNLLAGGFSNTIGEGDRGGGGPLFGENFAPWSDRLRNVEELLDQPALRDAVAQARERARLLRQEYKRDLKKPDWTVVQLQVLKPLFEVRSRVSEELARRDSKDPLVPIDRDPVPNRYAESVRKYYEELGKDK